MNTCKLSNTLLNNQWIKEEIKGEIRSILRQTKLEAQHTKTYEMQLDVPHFQKPTVEKS